MNRFIHIGVEDYQNAELDYQHMHQLELLAREEGFRRNWQMFRSPHDLLRSYVRLRVMKETDDAWSMQRLVRQEEIRLNDTVMHWMWKEELQALQKDLLAYYRYSMPGDPAPQRLAPGPMLQEYWRRLAEATGKFVSERCT